MKRFFTCLAVCVAVCAMSLSCGKSSKTGIRLRDISGKLEVVSTRIPGPLADYISLADDVIPYEVGEPDSDGDVPMTFWLEFKILKHASHIEYLTIDGDFKSHTMKWVGDMKFKNDQDAVVMLAEAIRNPDVNKITVPWRTVGSSDEVEKFKVDARQLKITESKIYVPVLPENFRVAGRYSSAIRLGSYEGNHGSIMIDTSDTGKCQVGLNLYLDSSEFIDGDLIVNIISKGETVITIDYGHYSIDQFRNINNCINNGNMICFPRENITYKSVDQLLNNSPIIELRVD